MLNHSLSVSPDSVLERELEREMLISGKQLRKIVPVSAMTIWRWTRDPNSDFPKPKRINGRLFWKLEELRAWWMRREAA